MSHDSDDDIVITGLSGQFPNSYNAQHYIDQLLNKVDLCDLNERPAYRVDHPEIPKLCGRLWEFNKFDAGSFGSHPFQSIFTDPAGRILIEQVHQAIFDAGIHPDELKGSRTGIFTGGCECEYEMGLYKELSENTYMISGATRSMNSQRISYALQLNGPSINLDTACSSGMFALEEAYRAIHEGRCDRAIVGGTNLCLDPFLTLQFKRLGVLNDGNGCRPFDNDATGYTRSEAIVAIVLQKRSEAKRIYSKVVHVKCNADGYKSMGITFPSFEGQLSVLNDVYSEGKVHPSEIGFLEAHGTGTKVGDPEELLVIDEFFKPTIEKPLLIGSVKGNIGHTEPSAGLCSLIKVIYALNNGVICPNIHYKTPKDGVDALKEERLKVVTEVMPFPEDKKYAGVNCFGFGGANAHTIVEKYTKPKVNFNNFTTRLVCYSGRTQSALDTIHEAINNTKDIEYLSLLQESFKHKYDRHLFRGYTLVGTNIKSSMKQSHTGQENIMLILGNLNITSNAKSLQSLSKIPIIKNIITQNKELLTTSKSAMALLYLQTLRDLGLQVELFTHNELSNSVRNFFDNKLTLKQLNQKLNTTQPQFQNLNIKQVNEWIKAKNVYTAKGSLMFLGKVDEIKSKLTKTYQYDHVAFGHNLNEEEFLCNIGHLYELGFQPQIDQMYPKSDFPVGVGTNFIGHLLKWKHKNVRNLEWTMGSMEDAERIDLISPVLNSDVVFYKGHVIDNRNLFPATGYLVHVWNMYADLKGLYLQKFSVVFENVRFHRACTLSDVDIELHIVIELNGRFEVAENGGTVVTGEIRLYDEKREGSQAFVTEEQEKTIDQSDYVLTSRDAYRELRLRGYNYRGLFRAIEKVTPSAAVIKWENNWVTFLDNMMQVCILQQNTRSLYVPVGLERLVIRGNEHHELMMDSEDKMVTVCFSKECMTVSSKYVEMRGLNAKSILLRKQRLKPVLESYQFVPNEYTCNLATSVRVNIQVLLECKQTVNFKATELVNETELPEEVIFNNICQAIEDLPLVIPDMTIITQQEQFEVPNCKVEPKMTDSNLVIICKDPTEEVFTEFDKALLPDGFVLCFVSKGNVKLQIPEAYETLTKHNLNYELPLASNDQNVQLKQYNSVYLLQKRKPEVKTSTIDVSNSDDLHWLKHVQDAMKSSARVVLVAQNNYQNGVLGFTNCLNKEPNSEKVHCVFLQDNSLVFDLNNNDTNNTITEQLKKQMKINVFNNGEWGTYRHLLLAGSNKVKAHHCFAHTLSPGDLSTLCWTQGHIKPDHTNVVKIEYSALNFRDLMLASGKLSPEAITRDRLIQDRLQGFEYVGYDNSGKRCCYMSAGGISNLSSNHVFKIDIPDHLSMEEAATIMIVYSTVMFGVIYRADLQKNQSVLIHSGTGGVGLAALNVCTHYNCNIFVTVGTQEKRDFLREHYPHIPASHIGNSRDCSFKEMIMKETNGRGVDIVLNSLAEEKLQTSVQCLAHGGTFVEIGKYDLDKNNQLILDLAGRECRHVGMMLDSCIEDPKCVKVLKQLWRDSIKEGYVKPLPRTIFKMDELDKAFKYLSTGKHIGKVLIQIDHDKEHYVIPRYYCDPNKTYIIFGGLGGFGLELADWLVIRGAKHIVLSSRSGITTGYQRYRIETWKSLNIEITILMENVINYKTCEEALKTIHQKHPIDGIFNLAVVLKDAIFEHQTPDTMKTSLEPKAILTKHLDSITRLLCPTMSTFVVFSSVSCGRGNAGQTNYGYSNSVMERICELRHQDGFAALAVQWGAVGDVGLLETLQKEHNEIAIGGTLQQKVTNCLTVFDQLILQTNPIVSSILVAEKFTKGSADSPLEAVVAIMGIPDIKSVSPHTPLPELGMDSMMAVEIKQTLERDFDLSLNPNDLRTLTFAKLEEMGSQRDKRIAGGDTGESVSLAMLMPGIQLRTSKETIVDYNKEASKSRGDFILAFPGIEADHSVFDFIAKQIKCHIKAISYDSITYEQENVDVIVDYLYKSLIDDIQHQKSFKFLAHSIGNFAAIELVKRLEAKGFKGKLILLDGAPKLMYNFYDLLKSSSPEELECNIIYNLINTLLPKQNVSGLKEVLLKGKTYEERVDLMFSNFLRIDDVDFVKKLKDLMRSFHTRFMSIFAYQNRAEEMSKQKIQSHVMLYKPTVVTVKNIAEDYELNMVCEKPILIETYEGNHVSILYNEKLLHQLSIEFKK